PFASEVISAYTDSGCWKPLKKSKRRGTRSTDQKPLISRPPTPCGCQLGSVAEAPVLGRRLAAVTRGAEQLQVVLCVASALRPGLDVVDVPLALAANQGPASGMLAPSTVAGVDAYSLGSPLVVVSAGRCGWPGVVRRRFC